MKRKRIFFLLLLFSPLLAVLLIFGAHEWVSQSAKGRMFDDIKQLPSQRVGLLLGTSKYTTRGTHNLYYKYRIQAAVKLYQAGKIRYILVSGDNGTTSYDEPSTIKEDLIRNGIPASRIYLDYAGFRTLDSIVRAKEIFGQKKLVVISQQFHNERALFLADAKGLEAVAFNAQDVSRSYGFKVQLREYLARVKVMLDLLIGKQPKFLGEKIVIGGQ
ncbi:MAG: ElyC/SanA/YdcF family protein [Bacteroidota bacterium]